MARRSFILLFLLLSATFVPVILRGGLYVVTAPLSYILWKTGGMLPGFTPRFKWRRLVLWGGHAALYGLLFALTGFLLSKWCGRITHRGWRLTVQLCVLSLPVAASFARVLTYVALWGKGGTYSFWTAVPRWLEKSLPP